LGSVDGLLARLAATHCFSSLTRAVTSESLREEQMRAYNVVRFRVKPGREEDFIKANEPTQGFKGFNGGALVKTGDRTYCFVGVWDKFDSLVAARPQMIAMLDTFRDMLEDLGGGLGVTDPVSGEVVLELLAAP
jgi:hypothetical protein